MEPDRLMPQPKILFLDLETSLMSVTTFSLYPDGLSHKAIVKDWYIICASWKWLGKSRVYAASVLDDPKRFKHDVRDDYYVVKTLREVIEEADAVCAHNLDKFDLRKLKTRLVYHNLPPIPKVHSIDTLKQARKMGFTSNRLDYLGEYFGYGGKLKTSNDLWEKATEGDVKSIKEMVRYNKVDVEKLEKVYLRLRPYSSGPHIGALLGRSKDHSCPNCGSVNMSTSKIRYTTAGFKRVQKQCKDCYSYATFSI